MMVLSSLITALMLNSTIRGRGFFRAVFFFPVLLSPVVVALIWKWILQRDGRAERRHHRARRPTDPVLRDPGWAFFWAIFVSIWAHMGFYTLILLAGPAGDSRGPLRGRRDGRDAAAGGCFWRITLPLLRPNLLVVFVLALIRAVQTFDEVFVLTGGGPGYRDDDGGAIHLRDRLRQPGRRISGLPRPPPWCWAWCCSRSPCCSSRCTPQGK